MAVFQLELAIALSACALVSAMFLYYMDFRSPASTEEGKIRLPEYTDYVYIDSVDDTIVESYTDDPFSEDETGEENPRSKGKWRNDEDYLDGKDPFDVTRPIDAVDGRPVDEGQFWTEVRTDRLVFPCFR